MVDSTLPNGDLVLLTAALDDPGRDLFDQLMVFADNLATAVPSVVGVTITVISDGVPVTLGVHDADLAATSSACLDPPFSANALDESDSTVVFYTAEVGAFADLLVTGLSTVAIAAALLVLPGTVGHHIHSIITKLGAHSSVEGIAITHRVAITHRENLLGAP